MQYSSPRENTQNNFKTDFEGSPFLAVNDSAKISLQENNHWNDCFFKVVNNTAILTDSTNTNSQAIENGMDGKLHKEPIIMDHSCSLENIYGSPDDHDCSTAPDHQTPVREF